MMSNLYLVKGNFLGFHLVSDQGQVEAMLLSLMSKILGFHLVSDCN